MTLPALHATTIEWTINKGQFNDGGTLTGGFTFNAEDNTFQSCCDQTGIVESGNFMTTPGSAGSGASYTLVYNFMHYYSPLDTWNLYVYSGNYSVGLFLASKPTDAGRTIDIIEGFERLDDYSSGSQQNIYFRSLGSGSTITASAAPDVPEPGTFVAVISGFTLIAFVRLRRRTHLPHQAARRQFSA